MEAGCRNVELGEVTTWKQQVSVTHVRLCSHSHTLQQFRMVYKRMSFLFCS